MNPGNMERVTKLKAELTINLGELHQSQAAQ